VHDDGGQSEGPRHDLLGHGMIWARQEERLVPVPGSVGHVSLLWWW